jgi:hypothetical protein
MHVLIRFPAYQGDNDQKKTKGAGDEGLGMHGTRAEKSDESHDIEEDSEEDRDGGHGFHAPDRSE